MLIVYLTPFEIRQRELLITWKTHVNYWPRSYAQGDYYNAAIPSDWWMLFNNPLYADMWLMRYPEQSRIVRTLFD